MKKMTEIAIILVLVVFFTALGDAVGGSMYGRGEFGQVFSDTLLAMTLLGGMSFAAYLIAMIPPLGKLPVIFWVSLIAAGLCSPLFPYDKEMIAMTGKVSIAVISTTVLPSRVFHWVKISINSKRFHGALSRCHWRYSPGHSYLPHLSAN